jgi:hypothetical protein
MGLECYSYAGAFGNFWGCFKISVMRFYIFSPVLLFFKIKRELVRCSTWCLSHIDVARQRLVKHVFSAMNIHKKGGEKEKRAACKHKKYTKSQDRNCWTLYFSHACKFENRLQQRLKTRNKICAYSQPGWSIKQATIIFCVRLSRNNSGCFIIKETQFHWITYIAGKYPNWNCNNLDTK